MGFILDSCIWVGIAAGQLARQAVIDAAGTAPVFVSVVSLGELVMGVHACADPRERTRRAVALRQIEQRPTRHTATAFGMLAAAVKQSGRSPRPRYNDLWIAAQAVEHDHTIMTLNTRDFASLPGVRIVNPGAGVVR